MFTPSNLERCPFRKNVIRSNHSRCRILPIPKTGGKNACQPTPDVKYTSPKTDIHITRDVQTDGVQPQPTRNRNLAQVCRGVRLATQAAISVSNVFKKFRRGQQFDSLRDLLANRILRKHGKLRRSEFWAVDDVSFDVQPGEALGIIGPNGAGKSTILKLLAGIMRPTQGVIHVGGRVSALIELGAGFHGDLTGRENIFLNASILGMTRAEVRGKFDEIIAFAGIEDFLDTPVKRYSSGMHARLGFAIAAHVAPRVLLVDEVLSVGDRVFRAKCLEKMRNFLAEGVAIVFVSHDLGSVSRFCNRAIVLVRGKETFSGPASDAVGKYYKACSEPLLTSGAHDAPLVRITNPRLICPTTGATLDSVKPGNEIRFEFDAAFDVNMVNPSFGMSVIRMEDHLVVFETSSSRLGLAAPPATIGDTQTVRYDFRMNLLPGDYAIGWHVRERDGLTYAAEDTYATRILVDANPTCGGVTHLNPRVEVSSTVQADNAHAVSL